MRKLLDWLSSIPKLVILGLTFTFLYFGYLIQIYGIKLIELKTMPLNEVGDFLAGVFGPVGFLWLVFGYFMQAGEISATRRSIIKQEKEKERAIQPIIEFTSCEYGYRRNVDHSQFKFGSTNLKKIRGMSQNKEDDKKRYLLAVNIRNHGELAKNIEIEFKKVCLKIPILESGRTKKQIEFPEEIANNTVFYITYFDLLGKKRNKKFKLNFIENKKRDEPFVFSPPEPDPLPTRYYQDIAILPLEEPNVD